MLLRTVRLRKPSPVGVIAVMALLVSLGGTAFAAGGYLITEVSQIKPSVVRELREGPPRAQVTARARSLSATETGTRSEPVSVPMTEATWLQLSDELNQITGQVTVTAPAGCAAARESQGRPVSVLVLVSNWQGAPEAASGPHAAAGAEADIPNGQTRTLGFENIDYRSLWQLFEPGTPKYHTITVQASSVCAEGQPMTVDSVSVDVVGAS